MTDSRRDAVYDAMMNGIEIELETFQWGTPDRNDTLGELYVNRQERRLHLTVWVLDNDDPDAEEVQPLDVSQDIVLDEPPRQQIRDIIHNYLRHEADEQMWFDGDRPFHPHREETVQ